MAKSNETRIPEIGKRISRLREQKGLTQLELAKALGVKRETVTQWETGTRDLKTEYTVKLADFFDVSSDEILRGVKAENVSVKRDLELSDKAIENIIHCKEYCPATEYPFSPIEIFDNLCKTGTIFRVCALIADYVDKNYFKSSKVLDIENTLYELNKEIQGRSDYASRADGDDSYYPQDLIKEREELEHKKDEYDETMQFSKWKMQGEILGFIEQMISESDEYL